MAEKKVIELEIKSESLGSLKSQLREAQNQVTALSEKFGATSQEAINAAKRAAELKDAIGDAKALTDAFNPDAKFNALSSSIGGVLNGFQAFEGALGLIGVESKDVQQALLQVQSAMALSQGLQGLMEAKDSFKQLGAVIGQTAIGQKLLNAAQIAGAAAMRVLNVVMAANPILLVVAAIGALSGALYLFTRDTETAAEANDRLNASLTRMNESVEASNEKLTKAGENRLKILESQGASEETLHKQRLQNLSNEEKARKYSLKAEEQTLKHKRAIYKQALEEEDYELAKTIQGEIKASEKRYKQLNNQHNDYITNKTVENNKFSRYEQDKLKEATEKEKEESEKRRQINKEAAEKLKAEKEKQLQEDKERAEKAKEFMLTDDIDEALRQQLIDSESAKDEIKKEAIAKEEEDQLMLAQFKGDLYAADIKETEKAEQEKNLARQKNIDLAIKYAQSFAQVYSALNNLMNASDNERLKNVKKGSKEEEAIKKKMFERDKKLRIVQTIIDTASNIVTSVRNGGGIPTGIPFGVMAGAMGALQIAAISKTKFEGAGGGGEEGATPQIGASGVTTPNFNIVGTSQATNPLSMLGSQPIQAYVVSGEVTTAQSLDRNRMNTATFG